MSAASCAGIAPATQFAESRLVFTGTVLAVRTVLVGSRRVRVSPARLMVTRYRKGNGPRVVTVRTAVSVVRGRVRISEDGIQPVAGEHWLIYTDSRRAPLTTSICAGSRRLRMRSRVRG